MSTVIQHVPRGLALLLTLFGCTTAVTTAHALQLIDGKDGVTVEAVIANKEPTRIRIENASITDVFGNIYSSNCGQPPSTIAGATSALPAVNPSGEIALECDRDKGEIYVRPMGTSTKPINLFVSTNGATYTLLLRRSDTPSDTIVIRDKSLRAIKEAKASAQLPLGPSLNHVAAMKSLLLAMAKDELPTDAQVDDMNREVQLWQEAKLTLTRVVQTRGLIGEIYNLINVSDKPMVLAEQEFDRADGNVVGIAIENLNLRPGDRTRVYVVRVGSGS